MKEEKTPLIYYRVPMKTGQNSFNSNWGLDEKGI